MHTALVSLIPSSSIESVFEARLCNAYSWIGSGFLETQLVIVGTDYVKVYAISASLEHKTGEPILSLLSTSHSAGRIKESNIISLPGGDDGIILAFSPSNYSVIRYDVNLAVFHTLSLHSFDPFKSTATPQIEQDISLEVQSSSKINRHICVNFERKTCILRISDDELALLALAGSSLMEDSSRPMSDDSDLLVYEDDAVNTDFNNITKNYSKKSKSYVFTSADVDASVKRIFDFVFLPNFKLPTIGFLYEPVQAWPFRMAATRDTVCVIVTEVNVVDGKLKFTRLAIFDGLPSDCRKLIKAPSGISGFLVAGSNDLLHIDPQRASPAGIALNPYASTTTKAPFIRRSAVAASLECSMEAGFVFEMPNWGLNIAVADDGGIYDLRIESEGRIDLSPLVNCFNLATGDPLPADLNILIGDRKTPLHSATPILGGEFLFVVPIVGDGLFLHTKKSIENADKNESIQMADVDDEDPYLLAELNVGQKQSNDYTILDRVSIVGPISDCCLGEYQNMTSGRKQYEISVCGGRDEFGSVAAFRKHLPLHLVSRVKVPNHGQRSFPIGKNSKGERLMIVSHVLDQFDEVSQSNLTHYSALVKESGEIVPSVFDAQEATIHLFVNYSHGIKHFIHVTSKSIRCIVCDDKNESFELKQIVKDGDQAFNCNIIRTFYCGSTLVIQLKNLLIKAYHVNSNTFGIEELVLPEKVDNLRIICWDLIQVCNVECLSLVSLEQDRNQSLYIYQISDMVISLKFLAENIELLPFHIKYHQCDKVDSLIDKEATIARENLEQFFMTDQERSEFDSNFSSNALIFNLAILKRSDSNVYLVFGTRTLGIIFYRVNNVLGSFSPFEDPKSTEITLTKSLLASQASLIQNMTHFLKNSQSSTLLIRTAKLSRAYQVTLDKHAVPRVHLIKFSRRLRSITFPIDHNLYIHGHSKENYFSFDTHNLNLSDIKSEDQCDSFTALDSTGQLTEYTIDPIFTIDVCDWPCRRRSGYAKFKKIQENFAVNSEAKKPDEDYSNTEAAKSAGWGAFRNILWHSPSSSYVLLYSIPRSYPEILPRDDYCLISDNNDLRIPMGAKPPTRLQHALMILTPKGIIADYWAGLDPDEYILSVKTPLLTTKETSRGRKAFVAVGTSVFRGEDRPARGRLFVLDVVRVVGAEGQDDSELRIKQLAVEDVKGPTTALTSLNGHLAVAVGCKTIIHTFTDNEALTGIGFVDVGVYGTAVATVKAFFAVADIAKAVSLHCFQENPARVFTLAKDTRDRPIHELEFIIGTGGSVLLCQASTAGLLFLTAYGPMVRMGGERLIPRGVIRFVSGIRRFCRLVLSSPESSTLKSIFSSAGSQNTSSATHAMPNTTDTNDIQVKVDNPSNSVAEAKDSKQGCLIACADGSVTCLLPIDEISYRSLLPLQHVLATVLPHLGGNDPRIARLGPGGPSSTLAHRKAPPTPRHVDLTLAASLRLLDMPPAALALLRERVYGESAANSVESLLKPYVDVLFPLWSLF